MITRNKMAQAWPLLAALVVSASILGALFLITPNAAAGITGSGVPSFMPQPLGPRATESRAVVVADLDGDQKPDIVTGDDGGQNYVYFYKEHFSTEHRFGTGTDATRSLAVGDVNDDRSPDIIVGNYQQQSVVYLNEIDPNTHKPTGNFYAGPVDCDGNPTRMRCFGTGNDKTTSVAVDNIDSRTPLDANSSAYPDIVIGNEGDENKDKVYINTAPTGKYGFFEKSTDNCSDTSSVRCFGPQGDQTTKVVIADVNSDGANDIIVGNNGQQSAVYLNKLEIDRPTGTFARDTATGCGEQYVSCFGKSDDPTFSLQVADMNADGALDIVVGNFSKQSALYLKKTNETDENNFFVHNSPGCGADNMRCFGEQGSNTRSVAVGDFNGDGRYDIIVGRSGQGQRGQIFLNKAGAFADNDTDNDPSVRFFGIGEDSNIVREVAVADLGSDTYPDGDTYLDIVAVGKGQLDSGKGQKVIFFNKGAAYKFLGVGYPTLLGIKVVDLDGDGDARDLIAANNEGALVFTNPGAASPGDTTFYPTGAGARAVAAGDLDTNGPLGLFVANSLTTTLSILKREASGVFTLTSISIDGNPQTVIAEKLKASAIDLIVTNGATQNNVHVLLGDGTGGFPDATRQVLTVPGTPLATAIQKLDVNDSFDLVVASSSGDVRVLTGTLQKDTTPTGIFSPQPQQTIAVGGTPQALAIGKLNADDIFDLIVASGSTIRRLPGMGDGTFDLQAQSFTSSIPVTALALSDINGDGADDLIVAGGGAARVYFNDKAGNFAIGPNECNRPQWVKCYALNEPGAISGIAIADMDGDTTPDLIIARSGGQSAIYLNDRSVGHSQALAGGQGGAFSTAVGDLNNDGALDLVFGRVYGQSEIYLNDGQGGFPTARQFGPQSGDVRSLAVGDMDSDGTLDIVVGDVYGQSAVYLNNHDHPGEFFQKAPQDGGINEVRRFGSPSDLIRSLAVADVDRKQGLDVIVGRLGGPNTIYFNDGTGNFDQPGRSFGPSAAETRSLAVGNLDNNPWPDIVAGTTSGQNTVYFNYGAGNSALERSQLFGTPDAATYSVALGDVDGEHGLDIIVGNYNTSNVVYLNNGTGGFSDTVDWAKPFGPADDPTYGVAPVDVDGDADLDVVVGNLNFDQSSGAPTGLSRVYLNSGSGEFNAADTIALGTSGSPARSVAAADLNGDGAPDLVVANDIGTSVVYYSDDSGKYPDPQSIISGPPTNARTIIADMDGDNNLDLVAVGYDGQGSVYLNKPNNTDIFTSTPDRTFSAHPTVSSIAVADVGGRSGPDGRPWLDIILGNTEQPNTIYLNDGSGNFPGPGQPFGGPAGATSAVAAADVDGDGDLDLVVSKQGQGQQSAVYLNDGSGNYLVHDSDVDCSMVNKVRCFGQKGDQAISLVAADMNRDGAPDLLVGYRSKETILYFNDGSGTFDRGVACDTPASTYRCIGGPTDLLAIADINGDRYLDVINRVGSYINDQHDNFNFTQYLGDLLGPSGSLAVADTNMDGRLDLVVGGNGEQSAVYLNDRSGFFRAGRSHLFGDRLSNFVSVATGDLNRDGVVDLVASSTNGQIGVFLHASMKAKLLANNPPGVVITKPGRMPDANFTSSSQILSDPIIPITYKLYDSESDPVRAITAEFSLDGGGFWQTAAFIHTQITDLSTSPNGAAHIYYWDTFASDFFGQSDNVVFRIKAYPGTHPIIGTVAGPYQQPYAATQTFPFRVRGTQVRVVWPERPQTGPGLRRVYLPIVTGRTVRGITGLPADPVVDTDDSGALVYRLQGNPPRGGPLSHNLGQPYRTNPQGFLPGRVEIKRGDQLVALKPIAVVATQSYTIYLTSALPTPDGLSAQPVVVAGTQVLTVTSAKPLILFNLSIALEWDARQNDDYIKQLTKDITRTSELLYDWTNGQAALGDITIYDDKSDEWDTADIRVYASNSVRPNADIGGIADRVRASGKPDAPKGQIRIGAVWNRYGEPSGQIGEDWPRALAHELGHYLFSLNDNYLGLDERRLLIPVESCHGVMNNPYIPDESEYRPRRDWLPDCGATLANYEHSASDWEIMAASFPWLRPPSNGFRQQNPGPSSLPLAVTKVRFDDRTGPALLPSQIFSLILGPDHYTSGTTRAFLFQGDRLIDLGVAVGSDVTARGVRSGDRLCAFDLPHQVLGCSGVKRDSTQLTLGRRPNWPPEVIVTPRSIKTDGSQEVRITVRNTSLPTNTILAARLYPAEGTATETRTLRLPTSPYTAEFTFVLHEPAEAGYVHIWVERDSAGRNEQSPRHEVVTEYGLGGSPTKRAVSGDAPASSPDGQVLLHGLDVNFETGQFYTLQAATNLPVRPPPWGTPVGKAYRLTASPRAPDLHGTSINFSYLGRDVTAGENKPEGLRIYYLPEGGARWHMLDTKVIRTLNVAIAETQGTGTYLLMSSIPKQLKPVWDSFIYSGEELPVEEALRSIDDSWLVVGTIDPHGQWLVYDRRPGGIKTLKTLTAERGYQIEVTKVVILLLRGGSSQSQTAANAGPGSTIPSEASLPRLPAFPAFYYGLVQPDATFTPTGGMPVFAWVGGALCGRGQTRAINGRVKYDIAVKAASPEASGCGAPGRMVTFQIGKQKMAASAQWSNDWTHEIILRR